MTDQQWLRAAQTNDSSTLIKLLKGEQPSRKCLLRCIKYLARHNNNLVLQIPDLDKTSYQMIYEVAVPLGHLELVRELFTVNSRLPRRLRIDPDYSDYRAFTGAIRNGHLEMVQYLLPHVNYDGNGKQNLEDASKFLSLIGENLARVCMEWVGNRARDVDGSDYYPLAVAYHSLNGTERQLQIFQVLLEGPRTEFMRNGLYIFGWACRDGHIKIVRLLLEDFRVDPRYNYQEPLVVACYYGQLAVVQMLLADSRLNISRDDYLSLRLALATDHVEIARYLWKRVRKELRKGWLPLSVQHNLLQACRNAEMIAVLVEDLRFSPKALLVAMTLWFGRCRELQPGSFAQVLQFIRENFKVDYHHPHFVWSLGAELRWEVVQLFLPQPGYGRVLLQQAHVKGNLPLLDYLFQTGVDPLSPFIDREFEFVCAEGTGPSYVVQALGLDLEISVTPACIVQCELADMSRGSGETWYTLLEILTVSEQGPSGQLYPTTALFLRECDRRNLWNLPTRFPEIRGIIGRILLNRGQAVWSRRRGPLKVHQRLLLWEEELMDYLLSELLSRLFWPAWLGLRMTGLLPDVVNSILILILQSIEDDSSRRYGIHL